MRFIENRIVIWRDNAAARSQIAKEQCVVDHDYVLVTGGLARMHLMAVFRPEEFTRIHEAIISVSIDLAPERVRRYEPKLCAVTGLRAIRPREEPSVLFSLRNDQAGTQLLELIAAQIVVAAFQLHDSGARVEHVEQLRNVLCQQL